MTSLITRIFAVAIISLIFLTPFAAAQTEEELKEATVKALTLMEAGRHADAVPHLDVLAKAMPDEANVRLMYGVALLTKSKQVTNVDEARKLSAAALVEFQAAKRLGIQSKELDSFIVFLGGDKGKEMAGTEKLSDAEKALHEAELNFARSKYDEAIELYLKALELDPKLYPAALHAGNTYLAKQDFENAEKFFQRAIAIDPSIETAYRYSATPLMKQKKYDQARDRYIEAFLAEPYEDRAVGGFSDWADITGAKLEHPKVKFPEVTDSSDGKPVLKSAKEKPDGLSLAWQKYTAVRADWRNTKFASAFPDEEEYRHSLKEEVDAIRSALKVADEQKVDNAELKLLKKMDADGTLESFLLLAHVDKGLARDYRPYWTDNRPKMRQYVLNYLISK